MRKFVGDHPTYIVKRWPKYTPNCRCQIHPNRLPADVAVPVLYVLTNDYLETILDSA